MDIMGKWIFLILLVCPPILEAREQLIVIQAVSRDKKSFIIRKGATDGVVTGRESLFTNEGTSIAAKPIEITREHSLWTISDPRGIVAFEQGDIISFSNGVHNIHDSIPRLKFDPDYRRRLQEEAIRNRQNMAIARTNFSFSLQETITDTSVQRESLRTGVQYEGLYGFPVSTITDLALGLRFDREVSSQISPTLRVLNTRLFVIGELLFNVNALSLYLKEVPEEIYAGIGGGFGLSQNDIDTVSSKGNAIAFPVVKVGYRKAFNRRYDLLIEGSTEYVRTKERFPNAREQETSVLNVKLALGLRLNFSRNFMEGLKFPKLFARLGF